MLKYKDNDTLPDVKEKVEIELEDGTIGWLYPDKAIRHSKGYYLVKPPYSAPTITTESAPAMAERREELKTLVAVEELTKLGGKAGLSGGVAKLIRVQLAIAQDASQGSNALKSMDRLLELAGLGESGSVLTDSEASAGKLSVKDIKELLKLAREGYSLEAEPSTLVVSEPANIVGEQ